MSTEKKKTTSEKLSSIIGKYKSVIIGVVAVIVIAIAAAAVIAGITDSSKLKALSAIDQIEADFVKEGEDLAVRQDAALEALNAYVGKNGVAGVRANFLAAEIAYQKKDFEAAKNFYSEAAKKSKKAYTGALNYVNAAVCAEETGNNEEAIKLYEEAVKDKEFFYRATALLNLGRVKESSGDFEGAVKSYQKLCDEYPSDVWVNFAKSRIIALKAANKVED